MVGSLLSGLAVLGLAHSLYHGAPWARIAGLAPFGVIGVGIAWFTTWYLVTVTEGDGAGYMLLGGLAFFGMCAAGLVSLLRRAS